MVKVGEAPYLECSTKGDYRFSAFKAYIKQYGDTIENLYQASKIFEDGSTNLTWRQAKGRVPINKEFCRQFYSYLWDVWFLENPKAKAYVKNNFKGTSDIFGKEGSCCQAKEIYRICLAGT